MTKNIRFLFFRHFGVIFYYFLLVFYFCTCMQNICHFYIDLLCFVWFWSNDFL